MDKYTGICTVISTLVLFGGVATYLIMDNYMEHKKELVKIENEYVLQERNLDRNGASEKFYEIDGKKVFLEIDGERLEDRF